MTTAIIIPCFNGIDHTLRCLESIAATTSWGTGESAVSVILVDNGSSDGTQSLSTDVTVHNYRNLGFARACNQGGAIARLLGADIYVFLNNDTVCHPGWLDALERAFLEGNNVGVAGSRLLWPDGRVQHTGIALSEPDGVLTATNREDEHPSGPVEAATGACLAVSAPCWADVGGFDDGYYNGYEDVDFCLQARRAGWAVWYAADSEVIHVCSASGPERWAAVGQNIARLGSRWSSCWQDPQASCPTPRQTTWPRHRASREALSGACVNPVSTHEC